MDTQSGQLYPNLETAREAGVPREHLQEVDVVQVTSGPFKGRRVFDDAKAKRP